MRRLAWFAVARIKKIKDHVHMAPPHISWYSLARTNPPVRMSPAMVAGPYGANFGTQATQQSLSRAPGRGLSGHRVGSIDGHHRGGRARDLHLVDLCVAGEPAGVDVIQSRTAILQAVEHKRSAGMRLIVTIGLCLLTQSGCIAEWPSHRTGPRFTGGPNLSPISAARADSWNRQLGLASSDLASVRRGQG